MRSGLSLAVPTKRIARRNNQNGYSMSVTEMALHVLAYNLTRVMNIVGIKPLLAAIRA
jgi:hypothetical protein